MANTPDINKRQIGLRVDLETCRKVEKRFARKDDTSKTIAFIRALEDATRTIKLTAAD